MLPPPVRRPVPHTSTVDTARHGRLFAPDHFAKWNYFTRICSPTIPSVAGLIIRRTCRRRRYANPRACNHVARFDAAIPTRSGAARSSLRSFRLFIEVRRDAVGYRSGIGQQGHFRGAIAARGAVVWAPSVARWRVGRERPQRCIPHRYTVRSSTFRKITFSTVIPMRITVNSPANTCAVSRFWLFS